MQDVESELGEPNVDDPRLISFVLRIVVLIGVTIGSALYTGYEPGASLYDMVTEADYALALIFGSFAMVATTYALGYVYSVLSLSESVDTTIDGFGIMLTAVTILVLAWGIRNVVAPVEEGGLGTGTYVADFVESFLTQRCCPLSCFSPPPSSPSRPGAPGGTMGIVTPIAVPVAWNLTGSHTMVAVMVPMVFSGAIFGDHSSPISDTTVLSSTFTGGDLIHHVRTQFYYALTVVLMAAGLMLVWGFTRITPFVLLPIGVLALVGIVYGLSEFDARRRGIEPKATRDSRDVARMTTNGSRSWRIRIYDVDCSPICVSLSSEL